jgi:hypothetical protein
MKTLINRIAVAFLIASLTSVAIFAKSRKQSTTLVTNLNVNGTLLKKGVYDVKFDEEKSELSFVKEGKVVARASVGSEKRETKAKGLELRTTGKGDDAQLVGVAFSGMDHDLVINGSKASR